MPDRKDLQELLKRDGTSIVITGDSLSYNRYDFDEQPRSNAYDCSPGIRSWSFLLRDAIHRNDAWFRHGHELPYSHLKDSSVLGPAALPEYTLPFGHGALAIDVFDKDEKIKLTYTHNNDTNKAFLYLGSVPGDTAARFDIYVDGVYCKSVNNDGAGQPFQGYNPLYIELEAAAGMEHEIVLTKWEQVAESPQPSGQKTAYLLGIGSKLTPVHLTGQGSRTAEWLLNNLEERVTGFTPDLVILIIGANDRVYRSVQQFDQDLRAVINRIYTVNPKAYVLLLSPPSSINPEDPAHDDIHFVPDAKSAEYNAVLEAVAEQHGCGYFATSSVFAGVPVEKWRYDNVHFTKFGNLLLAEAIAEFFGLDAALLR